MKSLLLAVLLFSPAAASAASPEEAYLAARDATIVEMGKLTDSGAAGAAFAGPYEKASENLAQMLRSMVGPIAFKGFAGPGKLNIGSLVKGDQGFGELDGLAFASTDGKSTLVVSPEPIFRHWLGEHKTWWDDPSLETLPQTPDAVIRSDGFYTQALQSDAAFSEIAELPLTAPAGAASAVALLGARSQDLTPDAPSELVVTLLMGGKLMIAEVPLKSKIPAVPACSKILKAAEPKIQAANDAYIASERKNAALATKERKLQTDASTAFRSCFAAKSQAQKGFVAAVGQAEILAGMLAGK